MRKELKEELDYRVSDLAEDFECELLDLCVDLVPDPNGQDGIEVNNYVVKLIMEKIKGLEIISG